MITNGVLSDTTLPQELLLDAIHHSETGHLKGKARSNAVSKKDAHGPYQFLRKNLHQMGYKMPTNITLDQVRDTDQARALADKYVTNYSSHHKFETPMQKIAAYNMGPTAAAEWIAAGSNFADLPDETKEYVTRASEFLEKAKPTVEPVLKVTSDTKLPEIDQMAQQPILPNGVGFNADTSITAGLDTTIATRLARKKELEAQLTAQYPKMSRVMREDAVQDALNQEFGEVPNNQKGLLTKLPAAVDTPTPRPALNDAAVAQDAALTNTANSMVPPNLASDDYTKRALLTMDADVRDPATGSVLSYDVPAVDKQSSSNPFFNQPHPDSYLEQSAQGYDPQDAYAVEAAAIRDDSNNSAPVPFLTEATQYLGPDSTPDMTQYLGPDSRNDAILSDDAVYLGRDSSMPDVDPVLDSSVIAEAQSAALQAASEKRRNATGLSTAPTVNPAGINGSDLIRIGGAMMGGSRQGGLNAIDRATSTYGSLIDAKNSAALEKYKADLEAAGDADDGTDKLKNNAAQISAGIVTGLIDEVIPTIDDDANGLFNSIFGLGGNTTGLFGSLLSKVGGTEANNLRSQLATIKSNIGFDKLQSMREASPTGGALGNVSEKENEYLQSVLGNVEQSQSPEQLKRNLMRLREAYLDIVHGIGNRPTNTTNYSTRSSGSSSGNTITLPNGVVVQRVP